MKPEAEGIRSSTYTKDIHTLTRAERFKGAVQTTLVNFFSKERRTNYSEDKINKRLNILLTTPQIGKLEHEKNFEPTVKNWIGDLPHETETYNFTTEAENAILRIRNSQTHLNPSTETPLGETMLEQKQKKHNPTEKPQTSLSNLSEEFSIFSINTEASTSPTSINEDLDPLKPRYTANKRLKSIFSEEGLLTSPPKEVYTSDSKSDLPRNGLKPESKIRYRTKLLQKLPIRNSR